MDFSKKLVYRPIPCKNTSYPLINRLDEKKRYDCLGSLYLSHVISHASNTVATP